jgi:hypothetical protein
MEQRPLRLGDIVDDYCPRERRITNHAIVALVEQSIRQTRCTTCDAEHPYKDAKAPRRRKKDEPDSLYEEVLADVTGGQLVPKPAVREGEPAPMQAAGPAGEAPGAADAPPAGAASASAESESETPPRENDYWPAHRTLIRATLPRVEGGEPPPRPIPEFTMHQRQGRGGGQGFRNGQGWANGNVNGNQNGHGGHGQNRNGFRHGRHGGHSQGQGQGNGAGGGGRHRHRGGKHRQPK